MRKKITYCRKPKIKFAWLPTLVGDNKIWLEKYVVWYRKESLYYEVRRCQHERVNIPTPEMLELWCKLRKDEADNLWGEKSLPEDWL